MQSWAKLLRWIVSGVLFLAGYPIAQEFFVSIARDHGAFDHPTERVMGAVELLSGLARNPYYQWSVILLAGVFIGAWLDWFARRLDRRQLALKGSVRIPRDPSDNPEKCLYIGRMLVWYENLRNESRLDIHAFGYNATGGPISIKNVRGSIRCEFGQGRSEILPAPYLTSPETMNIPIEDCGEIRLALGQNVPSPLARIIADRLDKGEHVTLYLTELNIIVKMPNESLVRLPVWNSIALHNQTHPMITGAANQIIG